LLLPNLGKPDKRLLATAMLTTDAHPVHRVREAKMATMVSPAKLVPQAFPVCPAPIRRFHSPPMADAVGAHSEHQARLVHPDQLAHLDKKALLAILARPAKTAVPVQLVHLAHQAPLALPANKDPLEMLVQEQPLDKKEIPAPLARMEKPVQLARTQRKEVLARMEVPARPAPLVLLDQRVLVVSKAQLADLVNLAHPAKMLNTVLARDAPSSPRRPRPPRPKPKRKPRPKPRLNSIDPYDPVFDNGPDFVIAVAVYCYFGYARSKASFSVF